MIGWFFKQGMAAVALDERFKAIDARLQTMETRFDERFKALDGKIDSKINQLDEKIDLVRNELIARIDGFRDEMRASIEVRERVAALEALVGRKSGS